MKLHFNNRKLLIAAVFLVSTPVFAVDLVGIHDLAIKNDPQLQAAGYRKDATGENTRQAWSNLLSTIGGSANRNWGDNTTRFGEVIINGEKLQFVPEEFQSDEFYDQGKYKYMVDIVHKKWLSVKFVEE